MPTTEEREPHVPSTGSNDQRDRRRTRRCRGSGCSPASGSTPRRTTRRSRPPTTGSVEFLDEAPSEIRGWADRRQQEADRIFALLTGPEAEPPRRHRTPQQRPPRPSRPPRQHRQLDQPPAARHHRRPRTVGVVFGVYWVGRPSVPDVTSGRRRQRRSQSRAPRPALDTAQLAALTAEGQGRPQGRRLAPEDRRPLLRRQRLDQRQGRGAEGARRRPDERAGPDQPRRRLLQRWRQRLGGEGLEGRHQGPPEERRDALRPRASST